MEAGQAAHGRRPRRAASFLGGATPRWSRPSKTCFPAQDCMRKARGKASHRWRQRGVSGPPCRAGRGWPKRASPFCGQGALRPGRQGLTAHRGLWPAWVPLLVQGQPGDLRGLPLLWRFPKASSPLLAFSCPHTRPVWVWPKGGLTSAWPRKAAEPEVCACVCKRAGRGEPRTRAPGSHCRSSLEAVSSGPGPA